MARMREIGASLDKGYRDDLNYNFGLLEALIGEANGLTDNLREEMLGKINNLQQQIDMLTGENIGELLERLNDSIQQALTAAQEARTAKTATEEATALATTATELANASALLAEEKANYANEKAVLAQEAADNANQEASNLSQLKIDVVKATQDANTATGNATQATQAAQTATDAINVVLPNVTGLVNLIEWSIETQYKKNNFVTLEGNGYMALRDNKGVKPPSFPVLSNADWAMFVQKGEKGEQGTGVRILGTLPDESALPPLGEPGDAYLINGDLYVWSDTTNDWTNVGTIKGPKGDTGPQGPQGEQGPPGQDADLTEVNQEIANLQQTVTNNQQVVTEHLAEIDTRLTDLESGASGTKADLVGLTREVAYMKLKQEASDRIEGGTVFADDFQGNKFGFTLDEINSRGFKIKNGKLVLLEDIEVPHNVANSTVVTSAHSTVGNGGRKLVRLDNGWLVATVYSTDLYVYFYTSKDNGTSWQQLCKAGLGATITSFAIAHNVNNVHAILTLNDSVYVYKFDAATVPNVNLTGEFRTLLDSQVTASNGSSLAIDPISGHLHAALSSKNAKNPNSFNIRYSKSIDGGITWSTVEQLSLYNTSGLDVTSLNVDIVSGEPLVFFTSTSSNSNAVYVLKRTGLNTHSSYSWTYKNVYNGSLYNQSSISAVVDKGMVIAAIWHGTDTTHPSTNYIRFSKTFNVGIDWSTMQKLVQGQNGTLTIDKNNKYIITYEDVGVIKRIESTNKGDTWSSPITVRTGTNPSSLYDPTFSLDFTSPPTIYMAASSVSFTGTWTDQVEVSTTEAALIYDIPSTGYVGAFVQKEGNVSINAFLNSVPMESVIENDEYQFTGSSADDGTVVKFRLEISRADTSNGENDAVTRILGGRA